MCKISTCLCKTSKIDGWELLSERGGGWMKAGHDEVGDCDAGSQPDARIDLLNSNFTMRKAPVSLRIWIMLT